MISFCDIREIRGNSSQKTRANIFEMHLKRARIAIDCFALQQKSEVRTGAEISPNQNAM